jgi:hypothetical protein
MGQVHIHNVLARSERVVGKIACTVRASGVGRRACGQPDNRTQLRRLVEVLAAHRSESEEGNKDASGPAQTRTPDVRSNGPWETPDLSCALWNKPAHTQVLRWAVGFLVDRSAGVALHTSDFASGSCWARVRTVHPELRSCIDSILKAFGDLEVYPCGVEAQVSVAAVLQSQVWERDDR